MINMLGHSDVQYQISNKFIKDKVHRNISYSTISYFNPFTLLEKDEWDQGYCKEFYFRYWRLNSNRGSLCRRTTPIAHSCLHNIHPKRSGYRCHWPPRSSPIAVVYDFRKDSGLETRSKDERIYSTRRSCQPSFEIFDWNRERMRRFQCSPSNVRSVHPGFDYHFPVNGSNIRFPTCGGVVCPIHVPFYVWDDEVWSVNLYFIGGLLV